jgi:threonine dehydrogenase-like Zn-dependent dehydrogenase
VNRSEKLKGWWPMKALVMTGYKEFEIQQLDIPEISSYEILLRVKYAGICGSDLSNYSKMNGRYPSLQGHEFAGVIEMVGEGVQDFQCGDTVAVNPLVSCEKCLQCKTGNPQRCLQRKVIGGDYPGAFAEFVKVPASACHLVSDALVGVLAEPLACGIRAARMANINIGDTVLVFGAGIIGLFCLKAAQLMGATKTILVDTNETRLQVAKSWGATHLYVSKGGDVVQEIQNLSNGHINVVLDAVGANVTRQQGIDLVEYGGRIVWIGRHNNEFTIVADRVLSKEIQITGTFCYSTKDFHEALTLLEQKIIVPDNEWLSVRPLEEGKDCFEEQISGPARYPKIVYQI